MKKVLAIFAAAAILCACGCGKQTQTNETAEPAAVQRTTSALPDEEPALPAVNNSGSTTAPVVTPTTNAPTTGTTAPTTTTVPASTQAADPTDPTTQPTTVKPTETTTVKPTETTTVKPTETTQPPKTAELLQSAVLAPVRSGTYTMTVRAFLKDHSNEDQLNKIVRSGDTAYRLSIPSANLNMRVFSSSGKYYLVAANQYCELTKAQYNEMCGTFGRYFPDFSGMKYQKTETGGSLLNKYTDEYFDVGGTTVVLRYEKGVLTQIQSDGVSLPFTVSSGADGAAFTLASDLKQVEYADMEFLAGLSQLI